MCPTLPAAGETWSTSPEYVASTTLTAPLPWAHSSLLAGDAVKAVAELKEEGGGDLHLIGSAALARTLLAHDLIDELQLMLDPVVLGGGSRLFPDDSTLRRFELLTSSPTSTGAMLLSYARSTD